MQVGQDVGGGFRNGAQRQDRTGATGPGRRRGGFGGAGIAIGAVGVLLALGVPSATGSASAAAAAHAALPISLVWQQNLPDGGSPIAQSSPSVATLDGSGPSVVVGDRGGNLWAFHLSNGSTTPGWPAQRPGPSTRRRRPR